VPPENIDMAIVRMECYPNFSLLHGDVLNQPVGLHSSSRLSRLL
jgi:hypothetical protein